MIPHIWPFLDESMANSPYFLVIHKIHTVFSTYCVLSNGRIKAPNAVEEEKFYLLNRKSSPLREILSPGLLPGRGLRLDNKVSSASSLTSSLWPGFLGSPVWMDWGLWRRREGDTGWQRNFCHWLSVVSSSIVFRLYLFSWWSRCFHCALSLWVPLTPASLSWGLLALNADMISHHGSYHMNRNTEASLPLMNSGNAGCPPQPLLCQPIYLLSFRLLRTRWTPTPTAGDTNRAAMMALLKVPY